jgi:ABC-type nickel/cobalt efflux system permease component RcnA
MLRGKSFDSFSKISNRLLVVAGILLLGYQINGYFTDDTHHHQHEKQIETETNEHDDKHEHSHGDGHPHSN